MKRFKILLTAAASCGLLAAQQQITIRAGTLLDGKGGVTRNTTIVIEGSRIVKIDPSIKNATYDLSNLTVMPGWIEGHSHIASHFDRETGRAQASKGETLEQSTLYLMENAYATLMAGFTTVQSPGAAIDKDLRDFVNTGPLPAPRILTSLGAIHNGTPDEIRAKVRKFVADGADFIKLFDTKSIREGGGPTMTMDQVEATCGEAKKLGKRTIVHAQGPRVLTSLRAINNPQWTPEQIREAVRKMKADGADLIKMFASKSFRDGGGATLNDQQIQAGCSEAKAQGLRTLVHVYGPETIKAVSDAGCTAVEHGTLITPEVLNVLAANGTYFDPNIGLVAQNYLSHRTNFLGIGNYTEEGMAAMERSIPLALAVFKQALATKGLKIVFGTDAVAGAHGHNVEELIYRVEKGGQDTKSAITSITSLSAESMNMGDKIGTLAPGMEADLIGVEGDPLKDITSLRHVVFVMKGGQVFKSLPASARAQKTTTHSSR